MKYNKTVILDCYTDEPSGYGVRPYLGTHQIHLAQALSYKKESFSYLTIDDLRYNNGEKEEGKNTNIRILNKTKNAYDAFNILMLTLFTLLWGVLLIINTFLVNHHHLQRYIIF